MWARQTLVEDAERRGCGAAAARKVARIMEGAPVPYQQGSHIDIADGDWVLAWRWPKRGTQWFQLVKAARQFSGASGSFKAHSSSRVSGGKLPTYRMQDERVDIPVNHIIYHRPTIRKVRLVKNVRGRKHPRSKSRERDEENSGSDSAVEDMRQSWELTYVPEPGVVPEPIE